MALKPIVMTPAYRYGAATPWGGSALKTVYGQDIPDERTGEALAFSALNDSKGAVRNGYREDSDGR